MNAVERIQAAIEKLEAVKAASVPGPWTHVHYEGVADSKRRLMAAGKFDHPMTRAEYLAPADAELIVTLHRTIDAQLSILHDGLIIARHWEDVLDKISGSIRTPLTHALLIADAILGPASH